MDYSGCKKARLQNTPHRKDYYPIWLVACVRTPWETSGSGRTGDYTDTEAENSILTISETGSRLSTTSPLFAVITRGASGSGLRARDWAVYAKRSLSATR